ncbi:hypothetical protein ACFV06_10950 [Streptomyces sp. NPDC059618]|uniref:hypothetical protein n=1 Tax=Streptomyces sp. NPDC059618 TaxID=3346887 RepID=UPI00369D248E
MKIRRALAASAATTAVLLTAAPAAQAAPTAQSTPVGTIRVTGSGTFTGYVASHNPNDVALMVCKEPLGFDGDHPNVWQALHGAVLYAESKCSMITWSSTTPIHKGSKTYKAGKYNWSHKWNKSTNYGKIKFTYVTREQCYHPLHLPITAWKSITPLAKSITVY